MRIVAGRHRGTNLFVPDIPETRPTMDRTRQAVFNILRSASWAMRDNASILQDALVLDVFAGSGAFGFEALSQGAGAAIFFENQMAAIDAIEKNRRKLKVIDATRVFKGDVLKTSLAGQSAQIAFFDPPYQQNMLQPAISRLAARGLIDGGTLLVLETHKTEDVKGVAQILDERLYGTSKITFATL